MYDSRKTLLNVLIDDLVNVLNIATVTLLVIFILNKTYLFAIPLVLSLIASVFAFVLDVKKYLSSSRINQRLNILVDGREVEKSLSQLRIGDEVVLYSSETINFVGQVKSGVFFVSESTINGTTKIIKKTVGSSVVKGSVVVEGSGVVEVTELEKRIAKTTFVQKTRLTSRIKVLNFFFSSLTLIILIFGFILKEINLDNVSKCAVASIPCLANIVLTIYLFVLSKKPQPGIDIQDYTFLSELEDVDVVCLDKTGTLTTGEYEIFKTVILSQTSFSSISLDANRAFEQVVSNIIKTTKEKGGYYSTLQRQFVYDVSKIIEESSSIDQNGLYSAVTIKGGSTYALGEPDCFEFSNHESVSSVIQEYEASGYRVLVLIESKNPLKSGLIVGRSTAIGLIVLQETIRENIQHLIEYCLENGKQVKVISGDRIAIVSEITRKAGLDNSGRATSIKLVPFEKIGLLLEEDVVFADATPSQKAFIVKELQKNGHVVAFIGDGDNDTQALKTADVAISLASGTKSANRCAQASITDTFIITNNFVSEVKSFKSKLDNVTAILYSQAAFATFYLLTFVIAGIFNESLYNPFEYNHLLIWTIFGILIPSIVLLCERNNDYKQKSFFRNFVADIVLLIVPVLAMYVLQLLQYFSVGYFGLPSDLNDMHETLITSNVVNNLSYLSVIVLSLVIVYNHFTPFKKYRIISFLLIVLVPLVYAALLAFNFDQFSFITQIDTKELTPINYFVMGVAAVSCSATYLLVLDIISTVKGENQNVKSKSKD